jgi:hypothetical protein
LVPNHRLCQTPGKENVAAKLAATSP